MKKTFIQWGPGLGTIAFILSVLLYTTLQSAPAATAQFSPTISPPSRVPTLSLNVTEWKNYTSNVFSMKYPQHIAVNSPEESVTQLIYAGSTQKKQRPWHDGIQLLISAHSLNGQSFKDASAHHYEHTKNTGTSTVISALSPTTIAGKTGYEYSVRSMGERTIILLPLSDDRLLEIVDATSDPYQRSYRTIVDTMLESLQTR